MRRWFRRKGKAEETSGENGAAPLVEETEPSSEAAGEEASLVAAEELAAEAESVGLEPPPVPAISTTAVPESATPPSEAGPEAVGLALPEAEDLEDPGEVPEAVRRKRFHRLRERLHRTREALSGRLERLFAGRKVVDAELLEELEELLITADIGVETSLFLIQALQEKLKRRELADVERLKAALQAEMVALLTGPAPQDRSARPRVVLLVGVNGVGKTTTIAKLAHRDRHQGLTPMLVAADTFRAAAVEQLEIWGERVGAAVVKQKTGSDPAAVVFDGLAAAVARGADTVYVDTAGRLHTKVNLMEELKKIHRTAAKKIPGAPHDVLLILDATTGQNALNQARLFHEAVGVTGLILTKMDGTAKGGVALAVVHETGIPLRYIGVGEAMEDLRPFDAEAFVEAILG
ncbi:MAG: signal recognition particle-docking protein FtsY [Desulfobacca sp. RBG_16_60_12]|nr:MAG: signal recognition particle-docking protein FtsY [Desulfobacca sp. RBG_16_60_12]